MLNLSLTNLQWIHQPMKFYTNLTTLISKLIFTELRKISTEHLRWMWHVSRNAYPATNKVLYHFGTAYALIVGTSFSPTCCDFGTSQTHFKYPSVLGRIPFIRLFWGSTSLEQYSSFSHVATWKQEKPYAIQVARLGIELRIAPQANCL